MAAIIMRKEIGIAWAEGLLNDSQTVGEAVNNQLMAFG
jgi:hypothetical protein